MTRCGLDVCDELNECSVYVNDCEGECADEVTGVTLLREEVAKARMDEMSWYDKFNAYEEVADETCMMRTADLLSMARY